MDTSHWQNKVLLVNAQNFDHLALDIFNYQSKNCAIYNRYLNNLQIDITKINNLSQIPFLPISFFKHFDIKTHTFENAKTFESSSTTGVGTSKHAVKNIAWYETICSLCFNYQFNALQNYCHLALLPAYLERQNSSLVHQIDFFIKNSIYKQSNFYLYNHNELEMQLIENEKNEIPTILWGVTFALLDFAEKHNINLKHTTIIETGGMKGRRKEITRHELHQTLNKAFNTKTIAGEYGMTELMSQAYAIEDGIYKCPPHFKVLATEINDPFTLTHFGKNGRLNIIDLANLDSCCFIATDDLGKVYANGNFEVLGRIDHSDTRGCNLLV